MPRTLSTPSAAIPDQRQGPSPLRRAFFILLVVAGMGFVPAAVGVVFNESLSDTWQMILIGGGLALGFPCITAMFIVFKILMRRGEFTAKRGT